MSCSGHAEKLHFLPQQDAAAEPSHEHVTILDGLETRSGPFVQSVHSAAEWRTQHLPLFLLLLLQESACSPRWFFFYIYLGNYAGWRNTVWLICSALQFLEVFYCEKNTFGLFISYYCTHGLAEHSVLIRKDIIQRNWVEQAGYRIIPDCIAPSDLRKTHQLYNDVMMSLLTVLSIPL